MNKRFTLVELLVVVAIIAILAALLLPALRRARDQALLTACLARQKQQGVAVYLHVDDHAGRMPIAGHTWWEAGSQGLRGRAIDNLTTFDDGGIPRPAPFTAALDAYLGGRMRLDSRANLQADLQNPLQVPLWRCPASRNTQLCMLLRDNQGFAAPEGLTDYCYNENALGHVFGWQTRLFGRLIEVAEPARVMLFADGNRRTEYGDTHISLWTNDTAGFTKTLLDCWTWNNSGTPSIFPLERHGGRINVLFIDGHAASIRFPQQGHEVGLTLGLGNY